MRTRGTPSDRGIVVDNVSGRRLRNEVYAAYSVGDYLLDPAGGGIFVGTRKREYHSDLATVRKNA